MNGSILLEIHNFPKAEYAHTSAWAASVLRQNISDGQLVPGVRLSEQLLSERLGISRNTLRGAFTMLIAESIVRHIPNRGVFVAAPGIEEVREIYSLRRIIEPGAMLWGYPTLTLLNRLTETVAMSRAARKSNDIIAMASANQEFHRTVISLSGSISLEKIMDRILAQMRLVFHAMDPIPHFHAHYIERKDNLVHLLRAGRRQEAAAVLCNYLDAAEQELIDYLKKTDRQN